MTPRAFTDSKLQHVSASQITTYSRCARKWWYEKILGLKPPPTEATEKGERIHKQMEDYYLHGVIPSYASARELLKDPRLPPRDAELLIEYPKDYRLELTAAGTPVKGRIDLLWAQTDLLLTILDWKSTSSFSYTKTPEELANSNTQLAIYSQWAFQRFPTLEEIVLGHGYIRTDERKPAAGKLVLSDPVTRPQVAAQFEVVEAIVEQMKDCASAEDPESVPGNAAACGDFRGCPFADRCSIGRAQRQSLFPPSSPAPTTEPRMSLKERFAARRPEPEATPAEPPDPAANTDVEVGIVPPDAPPIVTPYDELRTRVEALEAQVARLVG